MLGPVARPSGPCRGPAASRRGITNAYACIPDQPSRGDIRHAAGPDTARVDAWDATFRLGLMHPAQQRLPNCCGSRNITIRDVASAATFARECCGRCNTRSRTNLRNRRMNPGNGRTNPRFRRANPTRDKRTRARLLLELAFRIRSLIVVSAHPTRQREGSVRPKPRNAERTGRVLDPTTEIGYYSQNWSLARD